MTSPIYFVIAALVAVICVGFLLFAAALKYMNLRKKDLSKQEAENQREWYIHESIRVVDPKYDIREEQVKAALFATIGTGMNFFSILMLLIDIPEIQWPELVIN